MMHTPPEKSKDNGPPLLSVIIPFFTTTKKGHIHQRVSELLDTVFPEFVEVIFSDSTKEVSIASEYKNRCKAKNFLYIASHQGKNYSLGKARNDAAVKASGRYLFFMDIDFIYSNIFWESLYKIINREFSSGEINKFLILPCLYLNERTTNILGNNRDWNEFSKIRDSVLEGKNEYVSTIAVTSSTIIVNRRYFLWLGGFRSDYFGHGCEEFDFLHRLSLNYPLATRPKDYYLDETQRFPADYKGFRRYFSYYGLPYLFQPVFLLHRHHPRPLFNRFYRKRKRNEMKLQRHIREYDQGIQLPPLKSDEELSFTSRYQMRALPPIYSFISDLQASYGFHDKKYCGLFFYQQGIKSESGNVFRKMRKLVMRPRKFFVDLKLFRMSVVLIKEPKLP